MNRVEELEEALTLACETLLFYGDPDNYFAVSIIGDRPCGIIADDYDDKHNADFTDRELHGAKARQTMASLLSSPVLKGLEFPEVNPNEPDR